MKIKQINIGDFRCFQDLSLNLTYPEGHEKAGKPLDKVCIIGQSGTGKTTLLELIYLLNARETGNLHPLILELTHDISFAIEVDEWALPLQVYGYEKTQRNLHEGVQMWTDEEHNALEQLRQSFTQTLRRIIYFPAEDNEYTSAEITDSNDRAFQLHHERVLPRSRRNYWRQIISDITSHQEKLARYRIRISKALENGKLEASKAILEELEGWRKENPSLLEELGKNFLDPILSRFHLHTKTEFESLSEGDYLLVVNRKGDIVSEEEWSTGTKNIILKTIPLFALKPTKLDIIGIDEPENSLFPDVQVELIEHYRRLAPDSQLFVATHSPIIASAFEPWEVIDLEFDDEGRVVRNTHLIDPEKGWHVDNFAYNPMWLSYEGIYRRYFDFDQNGHPKREEKLNEAAYLKNKAQFLQEQGDEKGAKETFEQYKQLAQKLK